MPFPHIEETCVFLIIGYGFLSFGYLILFNYGLWLLSFGYLILNLFFVFWIFELYLLLGTFKSLINCYLFFKLIKK